MNLIKKSLYALISSLFLVIFAFVPAKNLMALDYVASADYILSGANHTLKDPTTDKTISSMVLSNKFELKGGLLFLDFNFVYLFYSKAVGGKAKIALSGLNNTATSVDFGKNTVDIDIETDELGIGYTGFFGKQNKGSVNFFGGIQLSYIFYRSKYSSSEAKTTEVFHSSIGSTNFPVFRALLGANYLMGSADAHISLIYSLGLDNKFHNMSKISNSSIAYKEKIDLTGLFGIGFNIGIIKYF